VHDERIVVNASPLILLTKIDATALLKEIASEIAVPAAVQAEVEAGALDPSSFAGLFAQKWLRVVPDRTLSEEIVEWDLGAGESQVLAFASQDSGWEAALDDLDARRCAAALGISVTGTLGVLLRAKDAGLISAARPFVERLLHVGAHLSDELVERALALVGESWKRST
jgi:predicted nucleic acid-binding protein